MQNQNLTLRSWYELQFLALYQADASPRTVAEYSATLTLWELLVENLSLEKITNLHIANFRAELTKLPGRRKEISSPATVNKHLRQLNHLLSKAGPPGPRNRDAMGLISVAPWGKQLRTFQHKPRAAGLPAIRAFYRACHDDWWRAFVVCAFHLGSRRNALEHLRECDVNFGSRLATFRAEFDKRRTERIKPLSNCVVRHLVPLRRSGLLEWKQSNSTFYRAWRAIENAAALTNEEKFRPHDLKRACGTQLARTGASTWAVKYMLDHAQNDVTGCSYLDPIEELQECVEKLPDPSLPNQQLQS